MSKSLQRKRLVSNLGAAEVLNKFGPSGVFELVMRATLAPRLGI